VVKTPHNMMHRQAHQNPRSRLPVLLALVGPGVLVAATGVGAGDLATGALAGNRLGLAVLWAVIAGALMKYLLTEGLARWQLATGTTLLEGAVQRYRWAVLLLFIPYLLMWSFFVGAALISASGIALHAVIPVFADPETGRIFWGICQSIAAALLVMLGGFGLFRRIMLACIALMFVTVVVSAILLCEDWAAFAGGLVVPAIPRMHEDGLGWTMALMGGVGGTLTILCYGYWMRETGRSGVHSLAQCRLDLGIAYAGTGIFGLAMVVIGDALPELPPGKGAGLIVEIARLVGTEVGWVGKWAFLIGAWSAIFSSLYGVWQSVPYLFADLWRLLAERAGDFKATATPQELPRKNAYRIYLWALATLPMAGLLVEFSAVQKVYGVFGALFMPLLALALLLMNGGRAAMGSLINSLWSRGGLLLTLGLFLLFAAVRFF